MLPLPLLMFFFFFFFLVVCRLSSVDSLVNYDLEIQHLEKVVSQGVNKVIMEHLMKLYQEIVLGYKLLAYDGCKSLCIVGLLPFPSKEFQISLLREDDGINTQRFLNPILQK
jgi:eukaryotic translation initiation factor 2C